VLARLVLEGAEGLVGGLRSPAIVRIAREFPAIGVDAAAPWTRRGEAEERIDARAWEAPGFDLAAFDARVNGLAGGGLFAISLAGDDPGLLERAAAEVLTRCQRHAPRRNAASRGPLFDEVLTRHRALHDLSKPLVRADYDHALDAWQWTLRLRPDAGLAAQVAALFHDVERLISEADARVEHRAGDYQAFKDAHAAGGARLAREALSSRLPGEELARALDLVARHERREGPAGAGSRPMRAGGDPDLELLNDADALSFFSLNSGGFMNYFGADHTRMKIAYTLRRLGPAARGRLSRIRHPAEVAPLVAEELARLTRVAGGAP
jgi:hypothetical protein